jgi:hypothetical protein
MKLFKFTFLISIVLVTFSCGDKVNNELFHPVSEKFSGVNFNNIIVTNDSVNVLNYEYLYNGGGVGVGDFNNDGLPDLVFSGNQVASKIYINNGGLNFNDVTNTSGINTTGKWCTGISVVDINQDGFDDIYFNVGGIKNNSESTNLLYINNGDLTFTESAEDYGLDDDMKSIQALFFDYDLDGDLDMYLLTNGEYGKSTNTIRSILDQGESPNTDRLYRNDFDSKKKHPVFTNVSQAAGITIEGFGLGVSVIDANNDDWPDIYVSNDYIARDFLFINQQDGTFLEDSREYFGHTSHFSMGNDVADINNDGFFDLFTVDMLPEDVKRRKLMSLEHFSHDVFQIALKYGYGHQYIRNTLQVNTGNGNFSEIGQLVGIDKTDWSWAPLIADFDNDGLNDIFITNGFGKDINDMDFVKFRGKESSPFSKTNNVRKSVIDCLFQRPAIKVPNYAFKNRGGLKFEKITSQWGLNTKTLSNGAAYADLDNDGDLDLIINNINQLASIYENTLREKDSLNTNYLKVNLEGNSNNRNGKGASLTLYSADTLMVRYNQSVRGFQSSVGNTIHFGLKDLEQVDSLMVKWPNNSVSILKNISVNQTLSISIDDTIKSIKYSQNKPRNTLFSSDSSVQFKYSNDIYNDYATQSLLLTKHSDLGPCMAAGDLNGDGLEDVFLGGSYRYPSKIFYQKSNGEFEEYSIPNTEVYEDSGAIIFDANSDGLLDLYITSGGSERYAGHEAYQDRLYIYTNGQLKESPLPEMLTSTSSVSGGDYDADGDIDLFVGGRVVPGKYPLPPTSYILENENGQFSIVTKEVVPDLEHIGMITSAVWTDFDNDSQLDLVVVGEMMPVTFFKGDGKSLVNITKDTGLPNTSGFWNSIISVDFDNDGDMDYIAGNLGSNSNLKVNQDHPIRLDYADFDENGSIDPIFSKFEQGQYYPVASLDQLQNQLPIIKKKFRYYRTFANSSTQDIIDLFKDDQVQTMEAHEMKSSYIENLGDNQFKISALPLETQIAPVNGILTEDINKDGFLDVILVGNNYGAELIKGRYDASFGHVLLNNGKGDFNLISNNRSGFFVKGDSRSIIKVNTKNKTLVLVGRNNDKVKSFEIPKTSKRLVQPESNECHAIVGFENGMKRKIELNYGNGYLSQSSNEIEINSIMKFIEFYDNNGELTREINLN